MPHIVLVHGAWHGAWCWHKTIPLLDAAGLTPHAIDLPGHGLRAAEPQTLAAYARTVAETLQRLEGPVILLGHSMGGQVISAAAELVPDRIATSIYLCAFLTDGQPLLEAAFDDDESILHLAMDRGPDGRFVVTPDRLKETFYADCSDADVALARLCMVPQSGEPFGVGPTLTPQNFGRVRRAYIVCTQDKAVGPIRQREMAAKVGVAATVDLDASHSPFFSNPEGLVRAIQSVL